MSVEAGPGVGLEEGLKWSAGLCGGGVCRGSSTSSPASGVCRFFDDGRSGLCDMIPHCSFVFISLIISDDIFLVLFGHLSVCLWRNVYLSLQHIF